MSDRRKSLRCRRSAFFGALVGCALVGSCGSDDSRRGDGEGTRTGRADAAVGDAAQPQQVEIGRWRARFYQGYFAETLRGDLELAHSAYDDVIRGAGEAEPELAARAALRLAELEARVGNRREAVELVARASALGRDDPDVVARADRMQAHLASVRSKGSEVRGPPAGTALEGVGDEAAARFADAEQLLAAYHTVRLRPRLEDLRGGVRAKERAMDVAVRAYREVIELGDPVASAAAEFRTASLYHDLALSLMFDLPPELEEHAAARLRRELRGQAIAHLRKALNAYERSLDEAADLPGSDRWRVAAERGRASVEDLLRGSY